MTNLILSTSRPLMYLAIAALFVAGMSFGLAYTAMKQESKFCPTLRSESVVYIKMAQLADKAEAKAMANIKGKSDHFWVAAGALDRELALENAALCGVNK